MRYYAWVLLPSEPESRADMEKQVDEIMSVFDRKWSSDIEFVHSWRIGGHWTTIIDASGPREDPRNYEPCPCSGSESCRWCGGTGSRLIQDPSKWAKRPADYRKVQNFDQYKEYAPAFLITADEFYIGLWPYKDEEWVPRVKEVLMTCPQGVVVVVDVGIE